MDEAVGTRAVWLRALVVASTAFLLGVVGHESAGGLLPAPGWLVAMLLVAVPLCVPVVRRPVGPLRLAGVLVAGQTAVHVGLSTTAGHRGDPVSWTHRSVALPGPASLPTVGGRRVGSLLDAYQSTGTRSPQTPTLPVHHLVADASGHAPMMAAHLVVAALVGLWLARGERALWTLLALLGRRLVLARDLVLAALRPLSRPVREVPWAGRTPGPRWLVPAQARRGPPLAA